MKVDLVLAKPSVRFLWGVWWMRSLRRLYICPLPAIGIVFIFATRTASADSAPGKGTGK